MFVLSYVKLFPNRPRLHPEGAKTASGGKNSYIGREKLLRPEVKMKVGYGGHSLLPISWKLVVNKFHVFP